MKKDSDYYRKQEQREQLKYIPIAIIYLVIGFFCYVALFIEEIEIGEYSLYGISKFFFITETLIFGGVGSLFSLGSLIFLVWTAELKRKSGGRGHPWFPILFSLIFLCIGFLSFLFTKYLSLLILENCHGINLYMAKIIYFEKHSFFAWVSGLIWLSFIMGIGFSIANGIIFIISSPFKVDEHLEKIREFVKNA